MKPYKCPVCDGAGKLMSYLSGTATYPTETCHACCGSGIVWGPEESKGAEYDKYVCPKCGTWYRFYVDFLANDDCRR